MPRCDLNYYPTNLCNKVEHTDFLIKIQKFLCLRLEHLSNKVQRLWLSISFHRFNYRYHQSTVVDIRWKNRLLPFAAKKSKPSDGISTFFAPTPQSTESFREYNIRTFVDAMMSSKDSINRTATLVEMHDFHRHNQMRALIYTVFLCCDNKQESIEWACNVQLNSKGTLRGYNIPKWGRCIIIRQLGVLCWRLALFIIILEPLLK